MPEEGFLNRWSRRKLAEKDVREADEAVDTASLPAESQAAPPAVPAGEAEEGEPERHPAEDIDIDSLDHTSDFSIFLQKGVPAALKRKALRKLWASDPILSAREQINDDFDIADVKTWGIAPSRGSAWKIGRGYRSEEELAPPPRRPGDREAEPPRDAVAQAEPDTEDAPEETEDRAVEADRAAAPAQDGPAPEDGGGEDGGGEDGDKA